MDQFSSGGGGNAYDFSGLSLEQISALVDEDHAQLPKLRAQAQGWRDASALLDDQSGRLTGDVTNMAGSWNGSGAEFFGAEAGEVTSSMSTARDSFVRNADGLDRIVEELGTLKIDMDEIRADWEHVTSAYATDPHVFDGAADNPYSDGSQYLSNVLYPQYRQEAQERITLAANTYETANNGHLNEPSTYDGPTYAQAPKHDLDDASHGIDPGSGGPGTGGAAPGGTGPGGTYAPGGGSASAPPSGSAPAPTSPAPTGPSHSGPVVEYPSAPPAPPVTGTGPLPGPTPPAAAPPGPGQPTPGPFPPAGAGPIKSPVKPPATTPIVKPPATGPGKSTPPGTVPRPRPGFPGSRPPTDPHAGTPRATTPRPAAPNQRGVIGERPGVSRGPVPGQRTPTPERGVIGSRTPRGTAAKPAAAVADEQGVLRNRAGVRDGGPGLKAKRRERREEVERRLAAAGPYEDDLFAHDGRTVEAVLRAKPPVRIRRRDAGPALRRTKRPT